MGEDLPVFVENVAEVARDGAVVFVHTVDENRRGPADWAVWVVGGGNVIQAFQQRFEKIVQWCHGRVRADERVRHFPEPDFGVAPRAAGLSEVARLGRSIGERTLPPAPPPAA